MNPIHTLINDTLALGEKAKSGPVETAHLAIRARDAHFEKACPRLARIAKIAVEALETLREHGQKMEFDDGDIDQSDFCANALAAIEREAGK